MWRHISGRVFSVLHSPMGFVGATQWNQSAVRYSELRNILGKCVQLCSVRSFVPIAWMGMGFLHVWWVYYMFTENCTRHWRHITNYCFVSGIWGAVFMFFWAFFAYDSPDTHPRISEKERKYIKESLGNSDAKDQVWIIITHKNVDSCIRLY